MINHGRSLMCRQSNQHAHKDRIINNLNLNKLNRTFTLSVNYEVFHLVYSISIDLIGSSDCLFLAFSWLFNLITLWSRDGLQVKLQA